MLSYSLMVLQKMSLSKNFSTKTILVKPTDYKARHNLHGWRHRHDFPEMKPLSFPFILLSPAEFCYLHLMEITRFSAFPEKWHTMCVCEREIRCACLLKAHLVFSSSAALSLPQREYLAWQLFFLGNLPSSCILQWTLNNEPLGEFRCNTR